jgi:hypothetical protein
VVRLVIVQKQGFPVNKRMAIELHHARLRGACLKRPRRTVYLRKTPASLARGDSFDSASDVNNESDDLSSHTPVGDQGSAANDESRVASSALTPAPPPVLIESYDIVSYSKVKNLYWPCKYSLFLEGDCV